MGTERSAENAGMLDAAPCGLVQTTEAGEILWANLTFCKWVGYAREALITKVRFQDLLTMGGRIFHQTHWAPLLQIQGSISEVKLEFVHRDKTRIPMVLNAIRHDAEGRVVIEIAAFVAWDRDKYEKELVLSRKRLEELVQETAKLHANAKDRALFAEQMVGIVSHDLRNPLAAIANSASMIQRGELSVSQQRSVERINRAIDRAKWLIFDLLDFTQARLGQGLSVTTGELDLHEVIAESVNELIFIYPGRRLEHFRVGDGRCVADGNRLTQLVGNLVSNAMTYGSHDTPVLVTSEVGADTFSVEVQNQGPPIPEEIKATLFEPMTRGTGATSSGRSVGLGLFIVREIARAQGGQVSVISTLEQGTAFRATFPRAAPKS